jgi:hypothetical protein
MDDIIAQVQIEETPEYQEHMEPLILPDYEPYYCWEKNAEPFWTEE